MGHIRLLVRSLFFAWILMEMVLGQQYRIDAQLRSDTQLVENILSWVEETKEGSIMAAKSLEGLLESKEFMDNVNYEDELRILQILSQESPSEVISFRLGVSLAKNERYSDAIALASTLYNSTDAEMKDLAQALLVHSSFLSGDFLTGSALLGSLNREMEYPRIIASQFDDRMVQIEAAKNQVIEEVDSMDYKYYFSVCAIFRDEGPYLEEWIAYHLMIGIEHFYLWEHQSNSSDPWESILSPYIAQGKVTLHRADANTMQGKTMDGCIRQYAKDNFWMAVIDIDEFLVPLQMDDVKDVLRGYEDQYGVFVSWRLFGGYPHQVRPEGLVIENYVHPISKDHSQEGKLIINARIAPIDVCKFSAREDRNSSEPGLNHNCFSWSGSHAYVVDEMRRPIKEDWKLSPPSYIHLQLNHYHSRSMEECMSKARRGFSWLEQILPPNVEDWPPSIRDRKTGKRCMQSEQYCLRSQVDSSIQRFVPMLKDRLASTSAAALSALSCSSISSSCVVNDTESTSTDGKLPKNGPESLLNVAGSLKEDS